MLFLPHLVNSLARGTERSRRSHRVWPKKATFFALIISNQIFKHRSNFYTDTISNYSTFISYNTIIVNCKMNRYFE